MENYSKIRQIGEGAFGKAILVKQKKSGKQLVMKEINISKMKDKEREESRKEVAVLAQLNHPNIVTYRESFEERGSLYIVMDFCEKGDLYSKINSQRGLLISEDLIMDWFVQLCLAIKHIHDRKILHRDIKSQNIFMSADGTIQLGDFGIAKVLNSTVELARTCIGTPYYLSPEICENRPYNNKSDIWSLGCVLYEMTTLKHAFEAGNMKNLVLKIIRGSYPPIPPKYSYDLRGLIAKLFKRAPRDRPSINSVLRQNFVSKRVTKFLTQEQMQDEFSHTVMHGKKLSARPLPPPPPSSRPPSARKSPMPNAPAPRPKYNPAAVYGAPVRKSKENRASDDGMKKRPGSANSAGRPGSASGDIRKRKMEMLEREKKRREEEKKVAQRKHREMVEKQKLARINKSREDNWKNMVDNIDCDKKNIEKNQPKEQVRWPPPRNAPAENVNYNNPQDARDRGRYDQYHAYLDKLQKDRDSRDDRPKPAQPPPQQAAYMAAPRPLPAAPQAVPKWHRPGSGRAPEATPVYVADPRADRNRKIDAKAQERAKIVDDFIQRKREAAMNKQRGVADIFGNPTPQATPRNDSRPGSARDQPQGHGGRDREEQEYLERLRQIRQHNYNDRRAQQKEQQEAASKIEAEARRRKIEALRQQAEDRAKMLKRQMEEQRKDMNDKARARDRRPVPAPRPVMNAVPAPSITAALNAVGAEPKLVPKPVNVPAPGITGALKAIGADPRSSQDSKEKSVFQQQKEEILKRLNEKKMMEAKEDETPDTARSRWGQDKPGDRLKELPLEMTASNMEATSQQDQVITNVGSAEQAAIAAQVDAVVNRRQWGRPGSTVLNALQGAPIIEGSLTANSDKSDKSTEDKEGVTPRSQWGGKRESVLDKLKDAPIMDSTMSSDKSALATDVGSVVMRDSGRRQWGGKRESVLERLKLIPLSRDSLVPDESSDNKPTAGGDSKPPAAAIGSTITISKTPIRKGTITISKADDSKTENSLEPADNSLSNQQSESASHDLEPSENDSNKSDVNKQMLPGSKPPLPAWPNKPDVLPKPVILKKPDEPMNFGDKAPESVNEKGEGQLFNKVESEDKGKLGKPKSGVLNGLATGNFDIGNTQMLRTCSEPDLVKLFKTLEQPVGHMKHSRKLSLDLEQLKEEDADLDSLLENVELDDSSPEKPPSPTKGDNQDEGDDEDEDVDDEDYEDLLSVRETMASLLLREASTDEDSVHNTGKLSLPSNKEDDIDEEEDENKDNEDDKGNEGDDDDTNNEDADEYQKKLEEVDDDEDENGADDKEDEDESDVRISLDDENAENSEENLFLTDDDSDNDTQFGDDEENYDLFSRLEESRAELETELGCDKFLKIYKTVQALQEDEDENMEDGLVIVTKMLGKEKEHLYPKIFQLVIADSAFQADI